MKIVFIGPSKSIHLQRWVEWFVKRGHEIYLIDDNPQSIPGVNQYNLKQMYSRTGNRLLRYIKFEFNSSRLRRLEKMLKIDDLKKIIRLRNLLRSINPDILHLHTLFYPAYLGVLTNFHPLVVTPWNGDIVWKYQWSILRKYAVRRGLLKADMITVDSEELMGKVIQYGIDNNKIKYISFGVDTGIFNPSAKNFQIRKLLDIDAHAPIVLSPRTLATMYNIDIIISAIPIVLCTFPDAIFVFSWHADTQKEELTRLVDKLGVSKNVIFAGKIVDRGELANYYAEADVCVSIPSSDTIAISLLEAMACGAVPVVSDLPSTRECVINEINGFIVPVRDIEATAQAIIKILSNKNIKNKVSEYNRYLVQKNFEWDKNMAKVENYYYQLLSERVNK